MNSEYYKNLLIKKLDLYSKKKFIIYDQGCIEQNEYHDQFLCFHFFEEFIKYIRKFDNESKIYDSQLFIPEQKFNYYLLIRANFYKTFKKMDLNMCCNVYFNDDDSYEDKEYKIFPNITKFIKEHYNKKRFQYNGVNYIQLKLRAFKNTFIPNFCLISDLFNFRDQTFRDNHCNDIKIMAIPVKKKYSNTIMLYDNSYKTYKKMVNLTPKLTLHHNMISNDYIENILDGYKDKKYYNELLYDCEHTIGKVYNEDTEKYFMIDILFFEKYDDW